MQHEPFDAFLKVDSSGLSRVRRVRITCLQRAKTSVHEFAPVSGNEVNQVRGTTVRFRWGWLAVLAVGLASGAHAQGVGRVRGKVLDPTNGFSLPGATVEVVGTATVARTDLDGVYDLTLPPGTHELKVTFSGYHDRTLKATAEPGTITSLDVGLQLVGVALKESITVTAETEAATSQVAAIIERKKSGAISEGIAREEMDRNADTDTAAAMTRVTGVSVVDGQYIYVRGLGERYSNTTLNGAVLPTTEPDKRVVPLDLFPTGLIEQVKVTKSYVPDKPAEFAGGLLEIEPINFPTRKTFSISISGGFNSQAAFKDVSDYAGGGTDFVGYGRGARALPSNIPDEKLVEVGILGTGFTRVELAQFGRSFANVWEPVPDTGGPNGSMSLMAGNSWGNFGAVGSIAYNYETSFRTERQVFYALGEGDSLRQTNDFDFEYSTRRATLGAVANLSYRFSGNHRLALENFYTNSGKDETRFFEGYQDDKGVELRNYRLFWLQETILSSKLSGEHFFAGLSNSRIDWRFTYGRAERDEPDLRENLYEFDPVQNEFVWTDESQSGFRMFNELTDETLDAAGDWNLFFNSFGQRLASVKLGGQWVYRDRFFFSRRMRFKPENIGGFDLTQSPEELFVEENIGTVFRLEEDTRRTDSYDAQHTILGGFAMADLPLTEKLRFVGGVRVESSEQEVITNDPFDPTLAPIVSSLDNLDVLPGVNLVYSVSPDTNLRLAVSQTVNRPEFRELAPYEFTDIVGGRAVVGNPALERALIQNADLRWEWFPGGGQGDAEVVALSAFYKDFEQPIEKVVEATAAFRTSFANAKGARNFGFELEARRALADWLLAGVNYTYTNSKIELERGAGQIQTSLDRALAGQSPHVVNAMLEFRSTAKNLSGRLLFNWFDDRISEVGALGIPDIYEQGRGSLDAVIQKRLGSYSLKLAADNLLNSEYLYTQGGLDQRSFKVGRKVSLGVSYSN